VTVKLTAEDRRFAAAIKERDEYTCQRCGRIYQKGDRGIQCAHIFTRRIKATRCDPDNAVALCTGCHFFIDTHPASKIEFFEKHLGLERFEALAARAHARRDRGQTG
jgi:hypothetical protein